MANDEKPQLDKFKEAARDLETDNDPKRFDDRLGKLVKHKPVERPEDSTLGQKDSSPKS